MPSTRFEKLRHSVNELRRLLLPYRFEPTGLYKDQARVRARAVSFRVLAHAELESYFEDRVEEIAKRADSAWKRKRYVSSVTLHLLGFSGREMALPPDTVDAPSNNKQKTWPDEISISSRLNKSVSDYVRRVTKENHGIKEKNIVSMLLPIGFPLDKCDPLLFETLNLFGEDRGMVAHSSAAAYVTQSVDPKEEYDRINSLTKKLICVDQILNDLLSEATYISDLGST